MAVPFRKLLLVLLLASLARSGAAQEDELDQLIEGGDANGALKVLVGISEREPPLDLLRSEQGSLEGTWQGLVKAAFPGATFVCPIPEAEYVAAEKLKKYALIIANARAYKLAAYAGLEGYVNQGGALLVTPNAGAQRPEINARTKRPLSFSTGTGFFNILHTRRVLRHSLGRRLNTDAIGPTMPHYISAGLPGRIVFPKPVSWPMIRSHHSEVAVLVADNEPKSTTLVASEAGAGRAVWTLFELPKLMATEETLTQPMRVLGRNVITWLLKQEQEDTLVKCRAAALEQCQKHGDTVAKAVSECAHATVHAMATGARAALAKAAEASDPGEAILLARRAFAAFSKAKALAEGDAEASEVYYVTTGGKDTNNGLSLETPWRTITYATSRAQAGDTVRIRLGAYADEKIEIANSGLPGLPISFESYRGSPIIVGKDRKGNGIDIAGKQHIRLSGLCVTRFRIGICLRDGTRDTVVSDCKANDNGWCGIYLDSDHNVLSDNVVYGNHVRGIGVRGSHNVIRGNDVSDNRYECIQLCKEATSNEIFDNKLHDTGWDDNGDSGDGIRIDALGKVGGNHVHHNRVYRCSRHGFVSYDHSNNNRISHNVIHDVPRHGIAILGEKATITHNVVYNCGYGIGTEVGKGGHVVSHNVLYRNQYGISVGTGTGTVVFNNIVVASAKSGIGAIGGNVLKYNCLWQNPRDKLSGEGDLVADPLFADAGNADFHLRSVAGRWSGDGFQKDDATSPCIDTGDPSAPHANEPGPDGGRVNMGAYGDMHEASKSAGGQ